MSETAVEEVTEDELIKAFIEAREREMMTAFPATVEAFHPGSPTPTVDVVPGLYKHLPDGQGNYVPEGLPKLSDVPVCFHRGGGCFVSVPLKKGDGVLVIICQKNIGNWRSTGNPGDPGDLGMHTLDGAVAIPCDFREAKSLANASDTNMIIGSDTDGDSRIEIKPAGGVNLGAGATEKVVTQKDFESFLKAWSGAAVGTSDGGATMRANTIAALTTAGWATGTTVAALGSTKIKAVR